CLTAPPCGTICRTGERLTSNFGAVKREPRSLEAAFLVDLNRTRKEIMSEKTLFKQLGEKTEYVYDNPQQSILESFPSPFADRQQNPSGVTGTIHIEAPEFTSLCPITG